MSFGRNAAKPDIIMPSLAPARFKNRNVGFLSSAAAARGNSLNSVKAAAFDADSCASDIFDDRISAAPVEEKQREWGSTDSFYT